MSKDKGSKNTKKAPADKSSNKSVSSYKSEGKGGISKQAEVEGFVPKQDHKSSKNGKS